MNSLQDLIKRLSNIGQVTEAEEKCSECGKVHEGDCDSKDSTKEILLDKDKVDESKKKKPDEDGDGIPDWVKGEKVKEGTLKENAIGDLPKQTSPEQPYEVPFGTSTDLVFARGKRSGLHYAMMNGMLSDPWYFKFNGKVYSISDNGDGIPKEVNGVEEGLGHQILGGVALLAALWGVNNQMAKSAYDNSPQLQQLIKLHQDAKSSGDIVKAKELQQRIENQKARLDADRGEVVGADGNPIKVRETALNLLRRYAGIQEAKIEEDEVEEGNEFVYKVQQLKAQGAKSGTKFKTSDGQEHILECGDMSMDPEMSPMSHVSDMASPIQVIGNPEAEVEPEGPHMEVPMAEPEEPKAKYTLNISNGDNNLSMTTDMPDEIIHIMKLAGVNKGAEVTKKAAPEGEQEVEESGYENTPDNTQARDPQAFGDIRDWGKKGTGAGKPNYPGTKASGDNPMSEQRMFEDYKNFKAGK